MVGTGSSDQDQKLFSNEDYTVGWICALSTEHVAAREFLDKEHGRPEFQSPNDNNDYTLGEIGKHKVVIAVMPKGEYGIGSAASVARDMLHSFPNIRVGLMVGIGGGAPSSAHDIRLGDVVVSIPRDGKGGVLQYDFGKTIQNREFQTTGYLNQPPTILRTAVSGLKTQYESDGHTIEDAIKSILEKKPRLRRKYGRPDPASDVLYLSTFIHQDDVCCFTPDDNTSNVVPRSAREEDEDNPAIHYGLIASANSLMKDAIIRDRLAAEKGVLCFEMEAAGLMNHFPCLVIRGICDYSDTHKNKMWQGYAAMTAAAYTKDLLYRIPPSKVNAEVKIHERVLAKVSSTAINVEAMRLDIEKLSSNIERERSQQEGNDILNWISPIDYGPQQSDYRRRRQPGTGQWLLDSSEYRSWVQKNGDTMFCQGIPGSGKTIIASIVVDDLERRFCDDKKAVVAYIYCDFRRKHEQMIEGLLSSLLKQLCQNQSSIPADVKSFYNQHRQRKTKLPLEDISRALGVVAKMYTRIFIVVDALDECQTSDGCRGMFLSEIFSLQGKSKVNIFATSRPSPDISNRFKSSFEIFAHDEDIRKYLDDRISQLPSFVSERPDLQNEISTTIIETANGMFLLSQLYFQSLIGYDTPKAIRTALQKLRDESNANQSDSTKLRMYDAAYQSAMERVEEQFPAQQSRAKQILSWITHAKRPLSSTGLQHALAVEVNESDINEENIPRIQDMVSVCGGLVTVDEDSGIIRLVHYTAHDYFERTQERWFPNAQENIASICIAYISFKAFANGYCETQEDLKSRLQQYPFYKYACKSWGDHARDASVNSAALEFLRKRAHVVASAQIALASHTLNWFTKSLRKVTGLHLAAWFGLLEAVTALTNKSIVDKRDRHGRTPLAYASGKGHEKVVQYLLLTSKVDLNSQDKLNRTPISYAAENGHEAVVKLFLATKKVDLGVKDNYHWIALFYAVRHGHTVITQLFPETGLVHPDARDLYDWTPLCLAAWHGHADIVQVLLSTGLVDPSSVDNNGRTPLAYASWGGHEVIVKLLLATGQVDPNPKDSFSRTPLYRAAERGYDLVVQLLLEDPRIDPDVKDLKTGQTPLCGACEYGSEAVARLLLADKRVDINARDKDGQTPLCLASGDGNPAVIQLLLADERVDVNSQGENGQTPLSFAAESGHEAVVDLLLAHEQIDPNLVDEEGNSPLFHATENGHDTVVRLLSTDERVDPNLQDGEYGQTPLSRASEEGDISVVRLLLANKLLDLNLTYDDGNSPLYHAADGGYAPIVELLAEDERVDINYQDRDYGQTPLSRASEKGHEAVARLLLVNDRVDPNMTDYEGCSPLFHAAQEGYGALVELLIADQRIELDLPDAYGQTPLSITAACGHLSIFQMLLRPGVVDVNSQDEDGCTPLSWAARGGHEAIVQLLLDNGADSNIAEINETTPLQRAIFGNHEAVEKLLLENGAVGLDDAYGLRHFFLHSETATARNYSAPNLSPVEDDEISDNIYKSEMETLEPMRVLTDSHASSESSQSRRNAKAGDNYEHRPTLPSVGTWGPPHGFDTQKATEQPTLPLKTRTSDHSHEFRQSHDSSSRLPTRHEVQESPLPSKRARNPKNSHENQQNSSAHRPQQQFLTFDSIVPNSHGSEEASSSGIGTHSKLGKLSRKFRGLFRD